MLPWGFRGLWARTTAQSLEARLPYETCTQIPVTQPCLLPAPPTPSSLHTPCCPTPMPIVFIQAPAAVIISSGEKGPAGHGCPRICLMLWINPSWLPSFCYLDELWLVNDGGQGMGTGTAAETG